MRKESARTMETWLPIEGFDNYAVSDSGRVKNVKTGRILKPRNSHEYPSVSLYNRDGRTDKFIHRIVGETFFDGEHDGLDVNHKNGHKEDSKKENLEWCTRSENILHAYRTGLKRPSGPYPIQKIRIVETGDIYKSAHECGRAIKGSQAHISHCLHGERKRHKGYHFEYVSPDNP